jgi:hypothetical protein
MSLKLNYSRILTTSVLLISTLAFLSARPSRAETCRGASGSEWRQLAEGNNTFWTPQEFWAWKEITAGRKADFNLLYGQDLDPASFSPEWSDKTKSRQMRSCFLTEILSEPFSQGIPARGVHIVGAHFESLIDLTAIHFSRPLRLERVRFDRGVWFKRAAFDHLVSLDGSLLGYQFDTDPIETETFPEPGEERRPVSLNMKGISSESDVLLRGSTLKGDAVFSGSQIKGALDLSGTSFDGRVNMDGLHTGGNLLLRYDETSARPQPSVFHNRVRVRSAKIGGSLDAFGSIFRDELNAADLNIGAHFIAHCVYVAGVLDLNNLRAAGDVFMNFSIFHYVAMNGAVVDDSIWANNSRFTELEMFQINVKQALSLSSTIVAGYTTSRPNRRDEIRGISLRNARIGGELRLLRANVTGRLDLSGANAGRLAIFDRRQPDHRLCPISFGTQAGGTSIFTLRGYGSEVSTVDKAGDLELDGFTYATVGEVAPSEWLNGDIQPTIWSERWYSNLASSLPICSATTAPSWRAWLACDAEHSRWLDWITLDTDFTAQPYRHLSRVLRDLGDDSVADEVLYLAREQDRMAAWHKGEYLHSLVFLALKLTVGYGIGSGPSLVLIWILIFTVGGTLILYINEWVLARGLRKSIANWAAAMLVSSVRGRSSSPTRLDLRDKVFFSLYYIIGAFLDEDWIRKEQLHVLAQVYFTFQRMAGWVLVAALAAAVSGLTQGR